MKSTDTVLMTLGRKGLTCGVIKRLTVCCFWLCVLSSVSTLLCRAIQSSVQELTEKICIYTQPGPRMPEMQN
ncbi:unnamed protein product, partial [Staurois parvus]